MATTSPPSVSKFRYSPIAPSSSSAIRSFMNKLMGGKADTLPRKLASVPFAASLLQMSPLSPDESLQRRRQLQRIVDVVVLDATRDKKNQIVIALKLSLTCSQPTANSFVPASTMVTFETTTSLRDVNHLGRILTFCVDKPTRACGENCNFCSQLRSYLRIHWVQDPLVNVATIGDTVLRKPSMAMHLAQLVALATGKSAAAPRVATVTKYKGAAVRLVPHLTPLGQKQQNEKTNCAVQNEMAAVLYDYFDVFQEKVTATTTTNATTVLTKEL